MKKMLHVENPYVRYSQDYAFPSAAYGSDSSYLNWIYSNAIQLYYMIDRPKFNLSLFYLGRDPNPIAYIPLFQYQAIDKDIIKTNNFSIINFVHNLINSGYYFSCLLDEYYVPCRNAYLKKNFEHGIMTYGYDDKRQIINIAGYDISKQFNFQEISYLEYQNAFLNVKRKDDICSCFKRNNYCYQLDIQLMRDLLLDFIYSKNTSERFRMVQNPHKNCYWGIEACERIVNIKNKSIDIRYAYTLYEHIRLMMDRFIYVSKFTKTFNETLKTKLQKITGDFYVLEMLTIKYNLSFNSNIYTRIVNKLKCLLEQEKNVLLEFYGYLCVF